MVPSPADRRPELDTLRGVAALLMVEQHLGIWLIDARTYLRELTRFWVLLNMLGGFAAPLFVFLAGAAAYLSGQRGSRLSFRGLKLLGLGYLLNLLVPSWFEPWSFYVLHVLGAWLVFAPAVLRLRKGHLLILSALFIALGAVGQVLLRVPREVSNDWMSTLRGPFGLFRLALIEGHFPLLPWLGFALAGAAAVAHPRSETETQKAAWFRELLSCAPWLIVGLLLLVGAELHPSWARRAPLRAAFAFSFYPATVAFCCLLIAGCTAALKLGRLTSRAGYDAEWIRLFGRTSLSLLFVHVVVFREILPRLGLFRVLSPQTTLLAILGALIAWYLWARLWDKFGFRFGLEWWLRVGEKRVGDKRPDSIEGPT